MPISLWAGDGLHVDSGRADCRPNFRPCHRPVAREEKRVLGSRGPTTRCTAGRTDFPSHSGSAVRCCHTLCLRDAWACAQHALLLHQRNWGAYSSISLNGEIFFPISNQSMLQADVIMTPIAAYNVDILHHRSAEAYAVTRYELVASHVQIHLLTFCTPSCAWRLQ